ncbi:MAG: L-seryl-tRNA(Sec) selenium transferase [Syntrophomonadaceae bacterium]|jgi:L-seryl-tRNA(Ser) seleniumtransferase|nr:L-seryl-tRNA(Sec) selenium transferase [Syntrophomonadaceae bacterium]
MDNLRKIPAIDEILMQDAIKEQMDRYSRNFVVRAVRASVEKVRQELLLEPLDVTKGTIMDRILKKVETSITAEPGTLYRVINGTGVVLHTNLGRAPLGLKAIEYINKIAPYYSNLEMDLAEGKRGSRYDHVESLLVRLTGAEAALVVNNNAAAVLLGLNTLALNREVIVSRGQLVEIGGAFRIPEVMKLSGARLVEVGTTNKTYGSDFEAVINENTALLFAAHTSNYKIIGFTQSVPMEELVDIGRKHELPIMHDLGSGALYDLQEWGLSEDPLIQDSIKAGIDIISFSGDKLLGGPQAGILVGKKKYIEAMKKNQLTRALRVDKLTIAALEGTLLEYLNGEPAEKIPILKMISSSEEQLYMKAVHLADKIKKSLGNWDKLKEISIEKTEDIIGGGAYPSLIIPGFGVQIELNEINLEAVVKTLRQSKTALIVRRQEEKMLISVRTLLPGDDDLIANLMLSLIDNKSILGGL